MHFKDCTSGKSQARADKIVIKEVKSRVLKVTLPNDAIKKMQHYCIDNDITVREFIKSAIWATVNRGEHEQG